MSSSPVGLNRPIGKLDAQGQLNPESYTELKFRGDYTGSNLIYAGFSRPGTATSAAKWQISKMTYDGSNNLTQRDWAQNSSGNATSDYVFAWDSRAGYTYS